VVIHSDLCTHAFSLPRATTIIGGLAGMRSDTKKFLFGQLFCL